MKTGTLENLEYPKGTKKIFSSLTFFVRASWLRKKYFTSLFFMLFTISRNILDFAFEWSEKKKGL